ncbi:MAG: SLATT domain-containing protein [Ignavibacteria bacterium]|nr:SLATT domain-containing protein [Ignavibacteria bacterium]
MEVLSPTPEVEQRKLQIFESQIRECFGRAVYSHKTHEKCADIYFSRSNGLKILQIVFSALSTTGIIVSVLGKNEITGIVSAVLSALSFGLNVYFKDFDPGRIGDTHRDVAAKLWEIREKYLSLLTDTRAGLLDMNTLKVKRDELQVLSSSVYTIAPRTLKKAYKSAQNSLKNQQELTFTDNEIDKFLPSALHNTILPLTPQSTEPSPSSSPTSDGSSLQVGDDRIGK